MGSMRAKIDLLSAASTINVASTIRQSEMQQATESSHYIVFGAGTSAGVVSIEAAHDPDYTGTWAVLSTVGWTTLSKVSNVAITGPHLALRHRISTTIAGGTVSTYAIVNA
jgi:hypothetical protein